MRIIVLMLLAVLSGGAAAEQKDNNSVANQLMTISRDINKSLPLKVDSEKVLDVTVAVHEILIFKFRIIDETVFNHPRFDKNKYLSALGASLGGSTCADTATFNLMLRGAKYNYIFINDRGIKLIDFTLDSNVCGNYRNRSGADRS